MKHKIQLLEKEKWQNYEAVFSSYADYGYGIDIIHQQDTISVTIKKVPLEERKFIKYTEKFLASSSSTVKAWGIVENDRLVAGIETMVDGGKNPRLHVHLLWVNEEYRRQGIAAALMEKAKIRAKEEGLRAVHLHTWSCNEHAIAFYLSEGFRLFGFDSSRFSNEDIEKYNVPLLLEYRF